MGYQNYGLFVWEEILQIDRKSTAVSRKLLLVVANFH